MAKGEAKKPKQKNKGATQLQQDGNQNHNIKKEALGPNTDR